jgi:PIN domain nuclease of toxin-antitoxin system
MYILLDTHTLIWFLEDNPLLKKSSKELIADENNDIYVSTISFYEMSIKLSIGKLVLPDSLETTIIKTINNDIKIIDLSRHHTVQYQSIPLIPDHKDPFDRMIIAVAVHEDLTVISADGNFKHYTSIINLIEA